MDFLFPHVSVCHIYYLCADLPGGYDLQWIMLKPSLSTLNKSLQSILGFVSIKYVVFWTKQACRIST